MLTNWLRKFNQCFQFLYLDGKNSNGRGDKKGPQIRPNRMKPSSNVPNEEQIAAIKRKKKVIWFSFWSNGESMIWRTVILLDNS